MSTAHITWDPIAEALCYNVYQVTDVDNPYVGAALVGDCIHATELDIPRQWFVRAVTDCGEGAVSAVVGVDCLDCPECPECPEVPTCDAEFFRIGVNDPPLEDALANYMNDGPIHHIARNMTLERGHCVGVIANTAPAGNGVQFVFGLHGFATGGTPTTLEAAGCDWPTDFFNRWNSGLPNLFILSGTGAGSSLSVRTNSADTITLLNEGAFGFTPDTTTEYLLCIALTAFDAFSDLIGVSSAGACYITPCDGEYSLGVVPNTHNGGNVSRGVLGIEHDTDELGAIIPDAGFIGFAMDSRGKLFTAEAAPTITRWNVATGAREAQGSLSPDITGQTDGNALCYAPSTDKIYWVGRFPARVFEIDPITLAITNTLDISSIYGGFTGPSNATYYPVPASNGKLVLTGFFISGKIGVINLDTFTVDGYVAGTKYVSAYSPVDNRVWAWNAGSGGIYIIDPVALTVDTTTMSTYTAYSYQAAYSPVTQKMYLGESAFNDYEGLMEIDPTDYSLISIPDLTIGGVRCLTLDNNGKLWMNTDYVYLEMEEIVDMDLTTRTSSTFRKTGRNSNRMLTALDGTICVLSYDMNAVHRFTP